MPDIYPPTNLDEQIGILKKRGMTFIDEERAKKYIRYIGYKRLSWYWHPFYDETSEKFKCEMSFGDILSLYIFDRKLRMLFLEASERIEICTKTLFSDILSLAHGSSWYLDANLFDTKTDKFYKNNERHTETVDHGSLMESISEELLRHKSSNSILKNFRSIYSAKLYSWDLFQFLTFGKFSRVLELTKGNELKEFYDLFSLPKAVFDNWIECIVSVRNICAHYGLFSFRTFSNKPKSLLKSDKRSFERIFSGKLQESFFAQFYIFSYFIFKISPTSSWAKRVVKEITDAERKTSLISFEALGFPKNWKEDALLQKMLSEEQPELL